MFNLHCCFSLVFFFSFMEEAAAEETHPKVAIKKEALNDDIKVSSRVWVRKLIN